MTAREYLREIEQKRVQIGLLKAELDACYASINLLPGVSYDGVNVQTTTKDSKVLRMIDEATDKYNRLVTEIEEYEAAREEAFKTVREMENTQYTEVLYLRYFAWMPWDRIAKRMGFKRDTNRAHQIHREALEALDDILAKEAET